MSETAHTVTARVPRRCADCRGPIAPGDQYVRHVAFLSDWNEHHIRVMTVCATCQTRYGHPMPPRRTRRKP